MSLHCNTCGKDVFENPEDYYMLKDDVWEEIWGRNWLSPYWIICKDCGEKMLGRKFTEDDFQDIEMNYEHGHLKRRKR